MFLTITWIFSDFIMHLGDVDIRLSLDWVKYLYISWSGKWRFFAYTVDCYTVHISFYWFRRNRAGPSCNIFINPLECVLCEIEAESDEEVHVYYLKSLSVERIWTRQCLFRGKFIYLYPFGSQYNNLILNEVIILEIFIQKCLHWHDRYIAYNISTLWKIL